jgi:hemin uptake protein HemP
MDVNHVDHRARSDWGRQCSGAEANSVLIDSRAIFAGRNEVLIRHGDQMYRLRITRFGKLILNK